jgi:hypothetical protein
VDLYVLLWGKSVRSRYVGDMQVAALYRGRRVLGIGTTLILDAWWRRQRRSDLAGRLRPSQPDSIRRWSQAYSRSATAGPRPQLL